MRVAAIWTAAAVPPVVDELERGGLPRPVAILLARRGVTSLASARRFLAPSREHFSSPFDLTGISAAVERILRARRDGERVAIVGDYDADGVTATALLATVMRSLDVATETILPDRFQDGYGFQPRHAKLAAAGGCRLLLTVDCGITSTSAVELAKRLGIEVILTDHHLPGPDLPAADTIVNPHVGDCDGAGRELTGVGLALKLAIALLERVARPVPLEALLRIACIGTIADVAPLLEENRTITALGLAALAQARSPGLRSLLRVAQVAPPVRADDVAFRLAPRLNAAGRLASAELALELLVTRDERRARELAEQLDRLNRERQGLELRAVDEAKAHFLERATEPRILVAWSRTWHRGVVGIAAGRLARELCRPVILLAQSDGTAVGSGRSVPGVDLHRFVEPWQERLERFGGHAQAIGLTASVGELERLRGEWEDRAAAWPEEWLRPRLEYELELSPAEIGTDLLHQLGKLAPHGAGNPEPTVRLRSLVAAKAPRRFGRDHLEVESRRADSDSPAIRLVAWGWASRRALFEQPFEAIVALRSDPRAFGGWSATVIDAQPADACKNPATA